MFYFAWCGANETFSAVHQREDEHILSFDLAHLEGQFATLSIEIKNPYIGLLAPGRQQWAWFSYRSPFDNSVTPLFYGRLTALPANLFNEVVTLQFLARPTNYLAQKQAIAETLKVSGYYDPIWIDKTKLDDPDTILETYTRAWHIDRSSLNVTTSDLIFGEDGTEEFMEEDSFYDSVSVSYGQAPQTQVQFKGDVAWTQTGGRTVNLPQVNITCWNGDQWLSDWPKVGASLGGGWAVANSVIYDLKGSSNAHSYTVSASWQNTESTHEDGDTMSVNRSDTVNSVGGGQAWMTDQSYSFTVGDPDTGTPAASSNSTSWIERVPYSLLGILSLRADTNNARSETLTFVMNSNLQTIMTAPADEPVAPILLTMSGNDVGVDPTGGNSPPIGDTGRSSFFPTDRGIEALQYPMLIARANLLHQARAVKVGFDCTFARAIKLSCRKNALLHDARLPGGQALGKITEYHLKGNGDDSQLIGSVQIESAVGAGGTITVVEGTPCYVDDGYVVPGYQVYSDAAISLPTSDITFALPVNGPDVGIGGVSWKLKYGVDASDTQTTTEPSPVQIGMPGNSVSADDQIQTATDAQSAYEQQFKDDIKANGPWLELTLDNVSGNSYGYEFDIPIGTLVVPKMIDLEAPSNA